MRYASFFLKFVIMNRYQNAELQRLYSDTFFIQSIPAHDFAVNQFTGNLLVLLILIRAECTLDSMYYCF